MSRLFKVKLNTLYNDIFVFLKESFLKENDQWFLWIPFFIGCGVYVASLWEDVFSIRLISLSLVLLYLLWFRAGGYLRLAIYGAMLFFVGVGCYQYRVMSIDYQTLDKGGFTSLSGVVEDVNYLNNGYRVILGDLKTSEDLQGVKKVRIAFRHKPKEGAPHFGNIIQVKTILRPPPEPVSPNGFDFRKYTRFREIGAVGFAVSDYQVIGQDQGWQIQNFRMRLIQHIRDIVKDDSAEILVALLTGEKGGIPEEVLSNVRISGLAHLLAISGLHIGMIALFIFFIIRFLGSYISSVTLSINIKKYAAFFAWIGIGFYLLLAGVPVPAGRAYVMTSFVLFAVMLDRTAISLRIVALAAIFLMLVRPEYVFQIGFHLSFIAVTGLISFYEYYRDIFKNKDYSNSWFSKIRKAAWGTILTSLIATLATAPFTAYFFGYLSTYSVLSNLLAVPLMGMVIMPLAFLAVLLWPLPFSPILMKIAAFGIGFILSVADWVAHLPGGVIPIAKFDFTALALMVFGLYWLFLWRTAWRLIGVVFVVAGLVFAAFSSLPDIWIDGEAKVIAVRDGDMMRISSKRRGKFAVNVWRKEAGFDVSQLAVFPEFSEGNMQCDAEGCVWRKGKNLIALPYHLNALKKDCDRADYIVTTLKVPYGLCKGKARIIDRRYVRKNGAQAIRVK